MKLYDLSHPFDVDGPAAVHGAEGTHAERSNTMELRFQRLKTIEKHGVNILQISFGNHLGTHIDAPAHLLSGGMSIDELPFETFFGSGVVLDIPSGNNARIGPSQFEAATPTIAKGDIVLICTGWSARFGSPEYLSHHPYLSVEGAHWLVDKGVRMVGIDAQSLDLPHSLRGDDFRHVSLRVLLQHGIPAIHNLANLESVAGRRVTVFSLPINFRGADGAPARVVAQLD